MSRSEPTVVLNNPAVKFIKWHGKRGEFYYYDKAEEVKANIDVPLPVAFVVLDELATITGFEKNISSNIYSNEVHRISDEKLRVQCFNGKGGRGYQIAEGLYADIKTQLNGVTGDWKYTTSVYALYKNPEGQYELVNFHFSGSALNAWIELKKKNNVLNGAIVIKESMEGQNGAITFLYPRFATTTTTPETEEEAMKYDKELQEYLREYKKVRGVKITEPGDIAPTESAGGLEEDIVDTSTVIPEALSQEGPDDLPF